MPSKPSKRKVRQLLKSVPSKRARIVIEHILEHGFITEEILKMIGKICLIILALVLSVSAYGCRAKAPQIPEEEDDVRPAVTEKPTYTVERGTVIDSIQFVDRIAPIQEKQLYFKTNGFVRAVFVKEEDEVKAGDLLAELETGDLQNQIAQAQVNLEKAQLRLAEIESNIQEIKKAEIELAVSELKLKQTVEQDGSARVAIAKANLDKAALALEMAKANDQGYAVPSYNLKMATLDYQIADYNYQLVLQDQKNRKYQIEILEKEIEANRLRLDKLREGSDPQAQTEMKLARLSLDRLSTQMENARIRSPIDGRVMSISTYPGKAAEAFRPVIIVADPTGYEIAANLTDRQVSRLSVGQKATIVLVDRPGEELTGTVRRLPYGVRDNKELLADADTATRISFRAPGDNVQIGDLARVTIVLEKRDDAIFLPIEAVRTFQGRRFVVVQDGDRRRRFDVKLGVEGDGKVEIKEGLQEGQIVVGQ
jgi:RND family efflux transporter MFP subunit